MVQIDPQTALPRERPVDQAVTGIAVDDCGVWVGRPPGITAPPSLQRFQPENNLSSEPIAVPNGPLIAMAADGGAVWYAVRGGDGANIARIGEDSTDTLGDLHVAGRTRDVAAAGAFAWVATDAEGGSVVAAGPMG